MLEDTSPQSLIATRRQALGLSLRDLADRVGRHANTVWRYEGCRWRTPPPPDVLNRLCEALDLDMVDVLAAAGYDFRGRHVDPAA